MPDIWKVESRGNLTIFSRKRKGKRKVYQFVLDNIMLAELIASYRKEDDYVRDALIQFRDRDTFVIHCVTRYDMGVEFEIDIDIAWFAAQTQLDPKVEVWYLGDDVSHISYLPDGGPFSWIGNERKYAIYNIESGGIKTIYVIEND